MRKVNRDYERIVIDLVEQGKQEGSMQTSAPSWVVAYGIMGMLGWTNRWFNPEQSKASAQEIASAFADTVLLGLARHSRRARGRVPPCSLRKLATEDEVIAVVGPSSSGEAIPLTPIGESLKVPTMGHRGVQRRSSPTRRRTRSRTSDQRQLAGGTEKCHVVRARFVFLATGCPSVVRVPDYPGLDRFAGEWHHTGAWPHEPVDLAGKRVGVIGVGSSGTQLIPVVAQEAEHLYVFQRTPNFTVPAQNAPVDDDDEREVKATYRERRAFARQTASGLNSGLNRQSALDVSPEERERVYEEHYNGAGFGFILAFADLLRSHEANRTVVDFLARKISEQVDDPEVADKLTPKDYPFGAKRPSVDTGDHAAFNRDDVTLVDVASWPIQEITETGLRTTDGTYDLDVLVFATGFDAMTGALSRIDVRGRDGLALQEEWAGGPRTYLGVATAGFPNLFVIAGPGSPSVLTNVMVSIEQHVAWLGRLLDDLDARGVSAIEASVEAEDAWVAHVDEIASATLYPEANSWYLGANVPGKPRVFMPYAGGLRAYRRRCAEVAEGGYEGFRLEGRVTASAS